MNRICSWCQEPIAPIADKSCGIELSHGICKKCLQWARRNDSGRSLAEFVEELPVPVLIVDNDCRISMANGSAYRMLGVNKDRMEDKKSGEIMECQNARLPGGCGNTVHCRACTIRNTVMATYADGKVREMVPAYLDTQSDGQENQVMFYISTALVSGKVLLQIDKT